MMKARIPFSRHVFSPWHNPSKLGFCAWLNENVLFFRIGLAAILFFAASTVFGAKDTAYYQAAIGKSRYELKTALHNIIKGHATVSYDNLFDAYKKTDVRENGKVWDMYSDCDFDFDDHRSNYSKECDCYNREHSFPKSWFGGKVMPMYSDLFHLYPTDGYVNNRRSNYPFGEVNNASYTSHNGSKVGNNSTSGYSDKVFEPVDEYKGDFARSYFYMATRYEDKIANWSACPICDGNNKATFKKWTVDLLLKWHKQDPVSQKEIDRNEAVYGYQHNRNPFIDFPELVEKIWGDDNTAFGPEDNPTTYTAYEIQYEYLDAQGELVNGSDHKFADNLMDDCTLKVLYPAAGDVVRQESVTARVAVVDNDNKEIKDYTLESVTLPATGNYTFVAGLWKANKKVNEQRVVFVYDNPDVANEDASALAFRIYPNPTGGLLTLEVEENNYDVRVFTVSGVEVMNLKALNGKTQINLEGMAQGVYVVEIATANGTSRAKVVLR